MRSVFQTSRTAGMLLLCSWYSGQLRSFRLGVALLTWINSSHASTLKHLHRWGALHLAHRSANWACLRSGLCGVGDASGRNRVTLTAADGHSFCLLMLHVARRTPAEVEGLMAPHETPDDAYARVRRRVNTPTRMCHAKLPGLDPPCIACCQCSAAGRLLRGSLRI